MYAYLSHRMLKWSCLLLKKLGCILLIVFKSMGEFSIGVMNLAEQAKLMGNLILLFARPVGVGVARLAPGYSSRVSGRQRSDPEPDQSDLEAVGSEEGEVGSSRLSQMIRVSAITSAQLTAGTGCTSVTT